MAGAKTQKLSEDERSEVMEDLRLAVYGAFLASWMQAFGAMKPGEEKLIKGWKGTMAWSEHVVELLSGHKGGDNIFMDKMIGDEVNRIYPALKRTVMRGVSWDAHMYGCFLVLRRKFC